MEESCRFSLPTVYHSYLSDPVFGDPCAYGGGDEDLKGDSQGVSGVSGFGDSER